MLTQQQYDDMRHAIGYNLKNEKDGIMFYGRNYFITCGNDESWEDLVNIGFAAKMDRIPSILPEDAQVYFATEKGINELENMLCMPLQYCEIQGGSENGTA